MSAVVYRVYDAAGTLLYVGSTVDLNARLRQHEDSAPWWPFKAEVRAESFELVEDARDAETAAIYEEHPRWNVKGRSPLHPDGPLSDRFSAAHLAEDVRIWREWRAVQTLRADVAAMQQKLAEQERHVALLLAGREALARTG